MAKRGYESQKTGQKVDDLLDKIDNLNVPEWALQESKPSYTAQEVHALPENTSIPRKTSDLVNDRGFISQESDPTVPGWAKQPSKPAYTAEEVGALPSDTPLFSGDYNDLRNKPTIPTVPENVSAFNNDAGYLTVHQDISGKEDKSNKVTSLSVQNTDTQYPSAKAVFDNLSTKQDTINDLGSIRSGASAGATAYQKPQAGIPESDLSQGVKDKMNEKEVSNNKVSSWQATPDNTHYPSEKLVKDSLDAIDKLVEVEYGVTTYAEVKALVDAGKIPFVAKEHSLGGTYKMEPLLLILSGHTNYGNNHVYTKFYFSSYVDTDGNSPQYYLAELAQVNDAWNIRSFSPEFINRRQQAFNSNTIQTYYYPSTKAVADYVDNVVGDIETLLAAI